MRRVILRGDGAAAGVDLTGDQARLSSLGGGFVRGITTSYVWRRRIGVVAEEKECVAVDSSGLELGATT